MSALPVRIHAGPVGSARAFLEEVFSAVSPHAFAVRLWDGTLLPPSTGHAATFTLVIRHPAALRRMFWSPSELSLGEAYIYDDFDIEGDMETAMSFGLELLSRICSWGKRLRVRSMLMRLPPGRRTAPGLPKLFGKLHSKERDGRAVRYHYDVSNEFYSLFLDRRMIYSSARFASADEDLDSAQQRKLDYICRTLKLQPGDRLLDVGCGWGGLIIHAAHHYGVHALGITLSQRQAEWARARIREAGLDTRCRVEICDYRDLNEEESFDKIASVGMVEHVGAKQLPGYFACIYRLLRRGGAFFNSGISRPLSEPAHRLNSFVDAYVFPDGELEPIHEILVAAERAGFAVRSTEDTREHYALTLRHWVRRLEGHAAEACRVADQLTYRVWRLYMAASAARFFSGQLHVFHTLLTRAGESSASVALPAGEIFT